MALPIADKTPRIFQHVGDVSELEPGMIGMESTVDADIGGKRSVYKDADGGEHKNLNKDENARVADLDITGTLQGGDVVKNNLTATASPTVSNDSTEGYSVGSIWVYAGASEYKICQDNSAGAAVWEALGGGGGTPDPHKVSHQDGGADEISVAALSGLLADRQTPLSHSNSHEDGGTDEISVANLSGLLPDGQTPLSHATSHQNGGADEIDVTGLTGVLATAQNADKLQGNDFAAGAPNDGDISKWIGGATMAWTPVDPRTLNKVTIALVSGAANDDDLTTTFDVDTPENILVTGGANNHTFDLGDATTYVVGEKTFEVFNGSTEFIIGKSSGATPNVFEFIPPMTKLTVKLLTNSTADGTWFVGRTKIPKNYGMELFDDALENVGSGAYSILGYLTAASGTGAVAGVISTRVDGDIGLRYMSAGTTPAGYAAIQTQAGSCRFGGGYAMSVEFFHSMLNGGVADATDNYESEFGFGNVTVGPVTNGFLFRHNIGSPNWYIVSVASGTETEVVTSIAVQMGDTYRKNRRVVVSSDASRVDFWIGDTHAGTITTNIPTASERSGILARITKSAGTGLRYFYWDGIEVQMAGNIARN